MEGVRYLCVYKIGGGGGGVRGENLVLEQVCCMPGFLGKVKHIWNFCDDEY